MSKATATIYLLAFGLMVVCSCINLEKSEALFLAGQYAEAASELPAPQPESKYLLSNLYRASAHLMAADYTQCLSDLADAEAILQEQDRSFNWGSSYLGRTYDGLMLQTYQALIFLIQGNPDYARVALNRLEERQGNAARRNQQAINQAQEAIKNERGKSENEAAIPYLDLANQNPQNRKQLSDYQHLLDQFGAYADYESPAGRFLSGAFRLLYLEDRTDADKAVFQLRKAYGMTNAEPARQLFELAELRAAGKLSRAEMDDYVVVLFENGLGPVKEERRYEIFVPLRRPVYAGIALPILVTRPAAYSCLELYDDLRRLGETTPLCSIDQLVATEFRKELPWLIASQVTQVVIKVALQVAITHAVEKEYGHGWGLAASILGAGISYATTSADVRGWNLLPKEFQAAVIRRPTSGRLGIATPGTASPFALVELPPGPALVYVKLPVAGRPALVTVMGPATARPSPEASQHSLSDSQP